MSSTTFFGEVNELSSRAIYWSDNESDEESNEPQETHQSINLWIKTSDDFNNKLSLIYVSLAKDDKTRVKDLTPIGSIGVDGITGNVGHIYTTSETSVWIQLNANHPNLKNYLLVQTIASLMKQIVSKCETSSGPMICLISKSVSKDSSSDDVITYLTTSESNLSLIPREVQRRPLLAPKMLDNLVESCVVEYCIVFGITCIGLIFPELQSKRFNQHFIPKQIIDSVHQFNDTIDSNIYLWFNNSNNFLIVI